MIDGLEALSALAKHGTMGKVALALHITQSAVSKRIAGLQDQLGAHLIEPRGRRVELTPAAHRLLARSRPLVGALKELMKEEHSEATGELSVDLSASVLISWGADALAEAQAKMPKVSFQVSCHHASVAIERVRAGESMVAIAQGDATSAPDLSAIELYHQRVVLVPSKLKRMRLSGSIPVMTIEHHTDAWHFIEQGLREVRVSHGIDLRSKREVQSFSAIVQLARAGFGHGLVPYEVARTLGVSSKSCIDLPAPISIPVSIFAQHSTMGRVLIKQLVEELRREAARRK